MYIKKPLQPSNPDSATWKRDMLMAPYFWIRDTDVESESNMEHATKTVGDVTIPILRNKKQVKPFSKLVFYKAKPKPRALAGTVPMQCPKKMRT